MKKIYIQPATQIILVAPQQMVCESVGLTSTPASVNKETEEYETLSRPHSAWDDE